MPSLTHLDDLAVERLKYLFRYDPDSGSFTRLVRTSNSTKIGEIAGGLNGDGYRYIMIDGRRYRSSRLAHLYMTNGWPEDLIDHRDLCRSNDKWKNIRLATYSQNMANIPPHRDNRSGLKGVTWDGGAGKWKAQIWRGGNLNLGKFDCPAAAHIAYVIAADIQFGRFSRGNGHAA